MNKTKNGLCFLAIGVALCLICCVAVSAVGVLPDADTAYAADSFDDAAWPENTFTSLNYGIYFYGAESDIPVKAGTAGANFNPEKPTVIFAHGLKVNEGYNSRDLLTLWGNTNSLFGEHSHDLFEYDTRFYKKYIELGYNVAHFYWSQISDDASNCDAKIWTSTEPNMGMDYYVKNADGDRVQGDEAFNPTKSVAMLFGDAIKSALGANYGEKLHLIGHSMGGQLVLATSEYLLEEYKAGAIVKNLLPERVTLLDPYFGMSTVNSSIDHLKGEQGGGRTTSELASNAMAKIADYGVAVETYSANDIFISGLYRLSMKDKTLKNEINDRFTSSCVWVHLNALQDEYTFANTHCMVIDYYFSTLYEQPMNDNSGNPVPTALMSVSDVLRLRGTAVAQKFEGGNNAFYMHNSSFVRVDKEIEEIDVTQDIAIVYGVAKVSSEKPVIAKLYKSDSEIASCALSHAGEYRFTSLSKGDYTVKFELESGLPAKINGAKEISVSVPLNTSVVTATECCVTVPNYALIIALPVVGGVLVIGGVVAAIILVKRKRGKAAEKK